MVAAMSATRTYPKEDPNYQLSVQDEAFFLLRVFGLSERPSVIVENRVSIWFKLYSGIIAVLAFAFTATNIGLVIRPHKSISPMFDENFSTGQRSVYPLWCSMCAILRACVSCTTLSTKYARDLERATADVRCETCLAKYWVPPRRQIIIANVCSCLTLVALVIVNFCMYSRYSERSLQQLASQPMTYLFVVETMVFSSSFIGTCIFLGAVSRGSLTRMFQWIESEVEQWCNEEPRSEEALKAMTERHNLCWRLTESYDNVFRYVLGVSFLFCVPIFCLVTTQVVKIYTEKDGNEVILAFVGYLLLWSVTCVSFTALICSFAASINSAAAAPRKHLMKLRNGQSMRVLHFLNRLNEYKIGFTFFGFFVIETTTILSILSLMVSYLVVFLQMAQADTLGSQSSTPPQQ